MGNPKRLERREKKQRIDQTETLLRRRWPRRRHRRWRWRGPVLIAVHVVLAVLAGVLWGQVWARSSREVKRMATDKNGKALRMEQVQKQVDRKLFRRGYHRSGPLVMAISPSGSKKTQKTLSPYFYVKPADTDTGDDEIAGKDQDDERAGPITETLPLKKTSAQVEISGAIARVKITQVYKNTGKKPIEAIYIFPASTRAAVHAMQMTIGLRTIQAVIEERKQARRTYEKAKRQGRRTALLEQQRANVFSMEIANIMPGDRIQVELVYSELLVPTAGTYTFVYPAVVGPRYGGGADPRTDRWISSPYFKKGEKAHYAYGLEVQIQSPIGIKKVFSHSHRVQPRFVSPKQVTMSLGSKRGSAQSPAPRSAQRSAPRSAAAHRPTQRAASSQRNNPGNRDFVLHYRLAGGRIETGALTATVNGEHYFLAMLEPPKRVTADHIPPREYIFVLDVSGSMSGFPLETAKSLIKRLLGNLKPTDRFNIILFAGTAHRMSHRSLKATPRTIKRVIKVIDRQRGGGSTRLLKALQSAYRIPPPFSGISRSVVIITDGYVGVEKRTFRLIRKNLNKANCFAFGIGSSVNRALIEGMARAGLGEPFVVLDRRQTGEAARRFRRYIGAPVLTDIRLSFEGVQAYDVIPKNPPDLLAQRPLVIMGKLKTGPSKTNPHKTSPRSSAHKAKSTHTNAPMSSFNGRLRVSGTTGSGKFEKVVSLAKARSAAAQNALAVLWARRWTRELMDQLAVLPAEKTLERAIVGLGLKHKLLTRYTSFVAVDQSRVNRSGNPTTVKQPLPLPAGVSNRALGGRRTVRQLSGRTVTGSLARPQPDRSAPAAKAGGPPPVARRSKGCLCTTPTVAPSALTSAPELRWLALLGLFGLAVCRLWRRRARCGKSRNKSSKNRSLPNLAGD